MSATLKSRDPGNEVNDLPELADDPIWQAALNAQIADGEETEEEWLAVQREEVDEEDRQELDRALREGLSEARAGLGVSTERVFRDMDRAARDALSSS